MKRALNRAADRRFGQIDGWDIVVRGRALRTASVFDEDWYDRPIMADPAAFAGRIRAGGLRADLFTFAQKIPSWKPRYPYPFDWDNVAAIPITTYQDWWQRLTTDRRKDVKRAEKQGIVVQRVSLDDALVRGIVELNNDIPFRQGKRFKHYGKDFGTVKREYATFPDRSEFLAAYFEQELVAILKMVYVGEIACFLEILSKTKHHDKRPINALISKAVEVAVEKKMSYLTYGRFQYGNKTRSSFTDFKQRNGFVRIRFPRYYIPLTFKGRVAIRLRLQRGLLGILPGPLVTAMVRVRSAVTGRMADRSASV
ncbi:MAG: hypothetical protein GX465_12900 [Acidobacteria bacterium]|nr:hypothetical protein [Acidobacteriota bacterium]